MTRPSHFSRRRRHVVDVIMAVALVLALGLPWTHTSHHSEGSWLPGYNIPYSTRWAVNQHDGSYYLEYTPGFVTSPQWVPTAFASSTTTLGREHPGRFGLVAALIMLVVARWRRDDRWRLAAGTVLLLIAMVTTELAIAKIGFALALICAVGLLGTGSAGVLGRRKPKPHASVT